MQLRRMCTVAIQMPRHHRRPASRLGNILLCFLWFGLISSRAEAAPRIGATSLSRDLIPEAAAVTDTYYHRVGWSSPGCPRDVFHGAPVDPDDLPAGIHGVLPFDRIRMDGYDCTYEELDDRMHLVSLDYIEHNEGLGNPANLSELAKDAIGIAGLDLALRNCGQYHDVFLAQYLYAEDLREIYISLVENALIPADTGIDDESLANNRGWMVMMPQILREPFRICIFTRGGVTDETPQPSMDAELPSSDEPETEDTTSEADADTGTDTDVDGNSDVDGSGDGSSDSTFGQANDQAKSSPEASDGAPACFPGDAEVELGDGRRIPLHDLEIGMQLRSTTNAFSPVYMFTHRLPIGNFEFVQLSTANNRSLIVSKTHFIYIYENEGGMMTLREAREVRIGDALVDASGNAVRIWDIRVVSRRGLYNPHTAQGDIVVDGFRASTYTRAMQATSAHALLAPLRARFLFFGVATRLLEYGAPPLFARFLGSAN